NQESLWLDLAPGMSEKLLQHLDRHRISEQVAFADHTRELAQLHISGPQAGAILARTFNREFSSTEKPQKVMLPPSLVSAEQIRPHQPLGFSGYDLLVAAHQAADLWKMLTLSGACPA